MIVSEFSNFTLNNITVVLCPLISIRISADSESIAFWIFKSSRGVFMKFDNEDAFKLASKFMDSNAEKLTEVTYFVKFLESYTKFDEWLKSEHPIESAKNAKKTLKFTS